MRTEDHTVAETLQALAAAEVEELVPRFVAHGFHDAAVTRHVR
jgi:hypothetical protein